MNSIEIIKSSRKKVEFPQGNLRHSLLVTGAEESFVGQIISTVVDDLYHGITTKEIHNRAFAQDTYGWEAETPQLNETVTLSW